MIDAVDRVIADRQSMDRGLSVGAAASFIMHVAFLMVAVISTLIHGRGPQLKIQSGFVVPLPPGGRGPLNVEAAAPAPVSHVEPPAPRPEKPKPTIIKPPKEQPKKGLPAVDAKKSRKKSRETPRSGAPSSTGTSSQTPGLGLEFGPVGPGVPGGTDALGDWYLAGVQRKIYMIWVQQMKPQMPNAVAVQFTIEADGSATDIQVIQSSGVSLLDYAAKRAVMSGAPFAPLPKTYGTNRITIRANFKPTS